jgi:hypothetical protein
MVWRDRLNRDFLVEAAMHGHGTLAGTLFSRFASSGHDRKLIHVESKSVRRARGIKAGTVGQATHNSAI